jgi:hypothetical protein
VSHRDIWIGLAQVAPVDPSAGDIGGGFVHVVARAEDEDELRAAAAALLRDLGFLIADFDEAEPVRERLRSGTLAPEIVELAIDTALDGDTRMSEIHTFPAGDEDDADDPADLRALADGETLVSVRGWGEYHVATGYIVGVGALWTLILLVDGNGRADGFRAVRLGTIAEIEAVDPESSFLPRLLTARPLTLEAPAVDLDDTRALLEAAGQAAAVVHLASADMEPGAFWIGRIATLDDDGLMLEKVSPVGTWLDEEHFRLDAITCIGFGGGFEDALAAAADAADTG